MTPEEEIAHNPFQEAVDCILKEAVARRKFFWYRPKVLACWMDLYNELTYTSRHLGNWNYEVGNPKYPILDLDVDEEYKDFIYDAWGATIDEESRKQDGGKLMPLDLKRDKTMDDYFELYLNPKYRYNSLFPDRMRVIDHLLLTIGNGKAWNSRGFIGDKGTCGNEGELFLGYPKFKKYLPYELKDLAKKWSADPMVKEARELRKRADRKWRLEEKAKKISMEKLSKEWKDLVKKLPPEERKKHKQLTKERDSKKYAPQDCYPISEKFSLITTMPDNAHQSYIAAGREVCWFILSPHEYNWEDDQSRFMPKPKSSDKKHYVKRFEDQKKFAKKFLKKWGLK